VADPEPAQAAAVGALRKAHLQSATAMGEPVPSDQQLVDDDFTTDVPENLAVGKRDGLPVTMPLSGLNAGLTGPGAAAAVRAIATELLAGAHRHRVELLIPTRTAATVFGLTDAQVDRLADTVPGLTVTVDLGAALRYLETEVLHRARMMSDHDVHDVLALRAADPGEPLPAIVLIAQPEEHERFPRALEAVLDPAGGYGVGALLLGAWPIGTTCRVDASGHVVHAEGPDADNWEGAQLFHLTPGDTAELLQTIRTARGDEPTTPADPSAVVPATSPDRPSAVTSAAEPSAGAPQTQDPARTAAPLRPPPFGQDRDCPVRVRLFGPVRVETRQGLLSTGLRQVSRDLLALLALHPEGITREQGIDALWTDRDLKGGSTMFHTAVNSARKRLRTVTGLREPMFITHAGGRYRLDAHLIDVDLWHFLHSLNSAATADDDPGRISALRRITELYTGELAEDLSYEWAERERERIRRTATNALVRLAHILRDDEPDDALSVLEQAFEHDPFSEPLASEVMRLQAQMGNADGVRRTYRLLAYRLNELDIDPAPETERLQSDLLRQHNLAQRKAAAQGAHSRTAEERSQARVPQPRDN
jgi:DNA-binding SARP family transcriptional activator